VRGSDYSYSCFLWGIVDEILDLNPELKISISAKSPQSSSKIPVYIQLEEIISFLSQSNKTIMPYKNQNVDLNFVAPDLIISEYSGPRFLYSELGIEGR